MRESEIALTDTRYFVSEWSGLKTNIHQFPPAANAEQVPASYLDAAG